KKDYEYWLTIKDKFKADSTKAVQQYTMFSAFYENIAFANDTLKKILGVSKLKPELLDSLKSDDQTIIMSKSAVNVIFTNAGEDADVDAMIGELKEAVDYYETQALFGYNTEFNARKIIGDNPNNLYEKGYGNNDVEGPDPSHGTHVAAIIAANRKNDIGIKGIADNVRIMSLRAVPNGDEHDKDVANAILYAVDNGAHIINMSFGKGYSPDKAAVDEAVRYAESRGELMVHAAGNDGADQGSKPSCPTQCYDDV